MTGPYTLVLALTFGVGMVMAIYLPMVSTMARHLESSVVACVPFFVVGLITSVLLVVFSGQTRQLVRLGGMPLWMPLCGMGACLMILGTGYLIPRVGASLFFVLLVAGQLAVGAVIAHYGLLNSAVVPLTLTKATGLALVVAGAYLAVR
ncbi:DMT family transporter [Acuticoccus mangrovi]|uniref:DMT family transporter n=1 Tax=Acuticoccus mangrovi TaxID=2796142 RepID=A0A934IMH7_9HYPH|nr:DMT family transporter [Acuticoccus mangrovi]MBJ3774952.1 DMT family transporter [Acuticoccus mangrovi]